MPKSKICNELLLNKYSISDEAPGTSESFAKSIGIKYTYTMEMSVLKKEPPYFEFPEESIPEFAAQVLIVIIVVIFYFSLYIKN